MTTKLSLGRSARRIAFATIIWAATSATLCAELLVFTAPWCKVCRLMDNTVQRMLDEGLPVREVNVDDHPELTQQYRLRGVPTLILVDGDREIRRAEGLQSYAQLRDWFAQVGQEPAETPRRPPAARDTTQRELIPRLRPSPEPVAPSLARSGGESDNPVMRRALEASVRLKVDDEGGHSYGSGTLIDVHGQHGLVVTCAHIFRDSQGKGPISVDLFPQGQKTTVRGQLVRYDMKQDIALVSIPLPTSMTPVPVARHVQDIQKQDSVFSVGCNRGADPTVIPSHIVDINRYIDVENLLVKGHPVDGRSGGGLFNAQGEIIGVCNAADHERDEGLFASLPVVHRILDQANLASVYQRDRSPSATPQSPHLPPQPTPRPIARTESPGVQHPSVPTPGAPTPGAPTMLSQFNAPPADTEIICIVRSKQNNQVPSQVIVVSDPSAEVLAALKREGQLR